MDYSKDYLEKEGTYFQLYRSEMLKYVPKSSKTILEVGCGNGAFGLQVKQKYDCVYWGVEPNKLAAEDAKFKLDKVINDILIPDQLPDDFFDCIVFNDVLEHLFYPDSIIRELKGKLRCSGSIVASIPNFLHFGSIFSILENEDFRYSEYGILDKTHSRFFTKKSIYRLFAEEGYSVSILEGINAMVTRKYRLLNLLLFNKLYNYRFLQFAVVAKKHSNN